MADNIKFYGGGLYVQINQLHWYELTERYNLDSGDLCHEPDQGLLLRLDADAKEYLYAQPDFVGDVCTALLGFVVMGLVLWTVYHIFVMEWM